MFRITYLIFAKKLIKLKFGVFFGDGERAAFKKDLYVEVTPLAAPSRKLRHFAEGLASSALLALFEAVGDMGEYSLSDYTTVHFLKPR